MTESVFLFCFFVLVKINSIDVSSEGLHVEDEHLFEVSGQ